MTFRAVMVTDKGVSFKKENLDEEHGEVESSVLELLSVAREQGSKTTSIVIAGVTS